MNKEFENNVNIVKHKKFLLDSRKIKHWLYSNDAKIKEVITKRNQAAFTKAKYVGLTVNYIQRFYDKDAKYQEATKVVVYELVFHGSKSTENATKVLKALENHFAAICIETDFCENVIKSGYRAVDEKSTYYLYFIVE